MIIPFNCNHFWQIVQRAYSGSLGAGVYWYRICTKCGVEEALDQ